MTIHSLQLVATVNKTDKTGTLSSRNVQVRFLFFCIKILTDVKFHNLDGCLSIFLHAATLYLHVHVPCLTGVNTETIVFHSEYLRKKY